MSIWSRVRVLEGTVAHLDRMIEIYHARLVDSEESVRELQGRLKRHGFPDERQYHAYGVRAERRRSRG